MGNDTLDPLALVKVLAVMSYPSDVRGREIMLRRHPSHLTIQRNAPRQSPVADGYAADLWRDLAAHQRGGFLAGALCLAQAQLCALGRRGDTFAVLDLAMDLANRCERAIGLGAAPQLGDPTAGLPLDSRQEFIAAFEAYRSASHLWAAVVYGWIQLREDLTPRQLQAIPRFLAYAAEIARLATSLDWQTPDQALALPEKALWILLIPDAITRRAETEIRKPAAEAPPALPPAIPGEAVEAEP